MRIINHPIIDFEKRKKLHFNFNNKKITAYDTDSIASALHAAGVKVFSHSLHHKRARGFFCGIGKCSSCFMTVDEIPNVRSCITPVQENMDVHQQEIAGTLPKKPFTRLQKKDINMEVVVVGSGPAGMMAALTAVKQGASVLLLDENYRVGGQLIKQSHKFFGSQEEKAGIRGIDIATELQKEITNHKHIEVMLSTSLFGCYQNNSTYELMAIQRHDTNQQLIAIHSKALIFCCGAMENMFAFPNNDLPGVYGAGGVQTLMNVHGVMPGNKVIMIGAGNVGLIVSYQLLQAGVEVDRVVEAMPTIGGYHVHAAKLRRCGVPIQTSHTIKEALGKDKVEGAIIAAVDKCFTPLPGTEEKVTCDTICIAVGLTPSIRLLEQLGVNTEYIPEAGGTVAIHDANMQTSAPGIYVAGDSSGIEEASTAMIEGELAGCSAAAALGYSNHAKEMQQRCKDSLKQLRSGPFGETARRCKDKIACCCEGGMMH